MANGATQAVENATRLSEIGFPEFTAKLITDTFNAITTSYLNQTAQYIGLVQAVSQTLQDYINNTADDISADEIGAFLVGIGGLNDDCAELLTGGFDRGRLAQHDGSGGAECGRRTAARCRLGGADLAAGGKRQPQHHEETNDRASNRASYRKQQIRSFADDGSSGRASAIRRQRSY